MFHWVNRLIASLLILMIGAAPLCACPAMTGPDRGHTQMDMTNGSMDPAMECCHEASEPPAKPVSPMQACDHCPVMNPSHVAVEKTTTITPPLHWVAWTVPTRLSSLIAFVSESPAAPTESPPVSPGGLFQLRCLLTL